MGGLFGYSSPNSSFYRAIKGEKGKIFSLVTPTRRKVPPSQGVSSGPNITAFHSMILLSQGAPLIPEGGSFCNLLKSRISLLRAGVDMTFFRRSFLFLLCYVFSFFAIRRKVVAKPNPEVFFFFAHSFLKVEHGHRRSCQGYFLAT